MGNKQYGIKAYGKWHRFATRSEYSGYLMEWIANSDGSEQDRAVSALVALEGGQFEYDSDAK